MGLNVLYSSDGIQHRSGFSTVARNTCVQLKNLGFNVYSQDWNTQHGKSELYGIPILPCGKHIASDPRTHHGFTTIKDHINRYNINALIMLGDIDMTWFMTQKKNKTKAENFYYLPIDSDYVPSNFINVVNEMEIPVAMADFGKETLNKCGADIKHVIYHGIDPAVYNRSGQSFRNNTLRNKNQELISDWSEKFIVINVDTNTPRKRQADLIHAWSIFAKDKDDVLMYMHTDPKTFKSGGKGFFNLYEVAHYHGLNKTSKNLFFPDWSKSYIYDEYYMAVIYRSADVFASANTGEGYGLTKHESMACGTPCIVPNYAASIEMVQNRGLLCDTVKWSNGNTMRHFDVSCQTRAVADVYDLAEKLQIYYDDRTLLKKHSDKAHEWAQNRTWESETKKWAKLIEEYCNE